MLLNGINIGSSSSTVLRCHVIMSECENEIENISVVVLRLKNTHMHRIIHLRDVAPIYSDTSSLYTQRISNATLLLSFFLLFFIHFISTINCRKLKCRHAIRHVVNLQPISQVNETD